MLLVKKEELLYKFDDKKEAEMCLEELSAIKDFVITKAYRDFDVNLNIWVYILAA